MGVSPACSCRWPSPPPLSGVGFFISPLPEAGGGEGEGEELGVVAGPTHPHPGPPPSRGREKNGRFRKNLPQKAPQPSPISGGGRKPTSVGAENCMALSPASTRLLTMQRQGE